MTWSEPKDAVPLIEVDSVIRAVDHVKSRVLTYAALTSVSTLRVVGPERFVSRYYMFGVGGQQIEQVTTDLAADPDVDVHRDLWNGETIQALPASCPDPVGSFSTAYIGYIVSFPASDNYAFEIAVPADNDSARAAYSTSPIASTCVQNSKSGQTWALEKVVGYGSAARSVSTIQTVSARYKDPCAIELPDGNGWLMTLIRCTTLLAPDDETGGPGACAPGGSLFDIVCYWSDTPTFTGANVRGPYLLVHGLEALPSDPERGNPDFRVFLGVPSAVILQAEGASYLYVYYTVAANTFEGAPYFDEAVGSTGSSYEEAEGRGGRPPHLHRRGSRGRVCHPRRDLGCVHTRTRGGPVRGGRLGASSDDVRALREPLLAAPAWRPPLVRDQLPAERVG